MFAGLIRNWKEARGSVLKRELEDCINRMNSLSEEDSFFVGLWMTKSIDALTPIYGPIDRVPDYKKKALAKMLKEKAKLAYNDDISRSYALALLSLYVESAILPGGDAEFVHSMSGEMIETAQAITQNAKKDSLQKKTG